MAESHCCRLWLTEIEIIWIRLHLLIDGLHLSSLVHTRHWSVVSTVFTHCLAFIVVMQQHFFWNTVALFSMNYCTCLHVANCIGFNIKKVVTSVVNAIKRSARNLNRRFKDLSFNCYRSQLNFKSRRVLFIHAHLYHIYISRFHGKKPPVAMAIPQKTSVTENSTSVSKPAVRKSSLRSFFCHFMTSLSIMRWHLNCIQCALLCSHVYDKRTAFKHTRTAPCTTSLSDLKFGLNRK